MYDHDMDIWRWQMQDWKMMGQVSGWKNYMTWRKAAVPIQLFAQ